MPQNRVASGGRFRFADIGVILFTDIHVLVVDDFGTMRRIISTLLRELGFSHISEAEDGAVALRMLRESRRSLAPIELVVTDWNMPGMDGIDLLRAIRADQTMAELPVLMVTAEAKRDNIILAAQSGADGYIVKPFTGTTLQQKLQQIFVKKGLTV